MKGSVHILVGQTSFSWKMNRMMNRMQSLTASECWIIKRVGVACAGDSHA